VVEAAVVVTTQPGPTRVVAEAAVAIFTDTLSWEPQGNQLLHLLYMILPLVMAAMEGSGLLLVRKVNQPLSA
jgi:hypothetical protein